MFIKGLMAVSIKSTEQFIFVYIAMCQTCGVSEPVSNEEFFVRLFQGLKMVFSISY